MTSPDLKVEQSGPCGPWFPGRAQVFRFPQLNRRPEFLWQPSNGHGIAGWPSLSSWPYAPFAAHASLPDCRAMVIPFSAHKGRLIIVRRQPTIVAGRQPHRLSMDQVSGRYSGQELMAPGTWVSLDESLTDSRRSRGADSTPKLEFRICD
jgi:hypothetical protein